MDYGAQQQSRFSRTPTLPTPVAPLLMGMILSAMVGLAPQGALAAVAENLLTDTHIAEEIEARLVAREEVSSHSIDVESTDGIVTLSGSVDTILEKDFATDIARSVRGVKAVVNDITVEPAERDDAAIKQDISDALLEDPATEAYEVTVWVEDGAVALTGTVDSPQESRLAELVAKGVRGVRGIDNRLAVRAGDGRFDSEIQAEVEQILHWNAHVDDSLMAVTVQGGTVHLAGAVRSLMEKAEAVDTVRGVRGVRNVDASELEVADVRSSTRQQRREKFAEASNGEIADVVERAFARDPRLDAANLEVSVRDGIATIRGVVTHHEAKRAAERDALNVVGVWRVRNLVKVRPGEALGDEQVEANVHRWLERDPVVNTESIETEVNDGVVRLTGSVMSRFEEARAISAASRARGVIGVKDHLEVWNSSPSAQANKDDWEIRQDILSRLYWSPVVDGDAVTVEVEDGVATLTGTVDTWPQRQAAGDGARAAGAERVRNQIRVRFGPPGYVTGGGQSEESS